MGAWRFTRYPYNNHRCTIGICCGLLLLWLIPYGQRIEAGPQPQVPIVQPDVVTTPLPATESATAGITNDLYHETEGPRQYTVQPGDTLWDVALEVGIDLETMPCAVAPTFQPDHPLVIGDRLEIPEMTIRCHRVEAGETLATIAAAYQTTPTAIADIGWNQLIEITETAPLPPGYHLRIPSRSIAGDGLTNPQKSDSSDNFLTWMLDQPVNTSPFLALAVGGPFANQLAAKRNGVGRATVAVDQPGAVPEHWPYGSGSFTWPLAGWLTQGYRYDHRAIDVAAPLGTTVTAADRGVVVRAGWNNQGYGLFVVIDHNIDYVTLYAHLSEIFVTEGQVVAQGDSIGRVGSTGNSTGPHLHFEIRDFGRLTNPLELLK